MTTLRIPGDIPMLELARFAACQGCELVSDPRGGLAFRRRPQATNANVVRFPRRHGQFRGADLPDGPEAA